MFYSQSSWRFAVGLTSEAQDGICDASLLANELYDSLAVRNVRGLGALPYGPDLDNPEMEAFFRRIQPWFTSIQDSLIALPGLSAIVLQAGDPQDYLTGFASVARNEIPVSGDVFLLETSKPFDRDDVLTFSVNGGTIQETIPENALDNIFVVPDPYVAVNPLEARNIQLSGRGERRIDFRNLPQQCTIRIFTVSGRLVKTIEHSAPIEDSIRSWNLQSDDGLDVSFGVYIYHVDAPGIGERIGRFSIIK